ncbi:MAG TPA: hypothetical protein PK668_11075 [Myxococcota bacterium]|nr:hypothetical protein [Myxococcota bacterium]HRY93293.1 hypothetical protein [Myxococcota bacterium]HSA20397.1 hypothetical protein [Myxococcota bacterium]
MPLPAKRSRSRSLIAWLAMAAAGALAGGCGEPACAPDGELGGCCRVQEDCGGELDCLTQVPGGLCSRDCAADQLCPAGSTCVRVISEGQGELGSACLRTCGDGLPDCRAGWGCRATSRPGLSVCAPG